MDEYYQVVRQLPECFSRQLVRLAPQEAQEIQEIRFRVEQPVQFTIRGKLVPAASVVPGWARDKMDAQTLQECFLQLCDHSVYAQRLYYAFRRASGGGGGKLAGWIFFLRYFLEFAHRTMGDLFCAGIDKALLGKRKGWSSGGWRAGKRKNNIFADVGTVARCAEQDCLRGGRAW